MYEFNHRGRRSEFDDDDEEELVHEFFDPEKLTAESKSLAERQYAHQRCAPRARPANPMFQTLLQADMDIGMDQVISDFEDDSDDINPPHVTPQMISRKRERENDQHNERTQRQGVELQLPQSPSSLIRPRGHPRSDSHDSLASCRSVSRLLDRTVQVTPPTPPFCYLPMASPDLNIQIDALELDCLASPLQTERKKQNPNGGFTLSSPYTVRK